MYKFEQEVNLINDVFIRNLTKECLEHSPPYFWEIPSSSTGKYHPEDERGFGGEVFHTRRVVRVAEDLCRSFNITGRDRDFVISASIMHDFTKNGYPNNTGHTVYGHGALWLNIVREFMPEMIFNQEVKVLAELIGNHMGIFDFPLSVANNAMGLIVQLADYISSRSYIDAKVETTNIIDKE